VPQTAKNFAEKLNKSLDDLGMPNNTKERAAKLSKLLDVPRQQAWNLIEGLQKPDQDLLERIAQELEVDIAWLLS